MAMSLTMLALVYCSSFGWATASFNTVSTIGSHMVLQRGVVNPIWGTTDGKPQTITVKVGKEIQDVQTLSATDDDKTFEVNINPFTAGNHGDIVISSTSGFAITLVDVLFGDVLLCSGQSNMVFSVGQSYSGAEHIKEANNPKYQSIRLLTVKPTGSPTPFTNATIEQPWVRANSTSVGNMKPFSYFSAVCWYTGVNLFNTMNGSVPLGLLTSAYGGTRVHQWSSSDALAKCNQSERMDSVTFSKADTIDASPVVGSDNSVMYNGMINPILKQRFIGIFWLQGESDVNPSDSTMQPQRGGAYYACQIKAMVADWRVKFNSPTIPFMWVLLSPWVGHEAGTSYYQLPSIRAAQFSVLELPFTGFSSAIDLGDPDPTTNPWDAVHFRTKWPLGQRLAKVAEKLVYKNEGIQTQGPQAISLAPGAAPDTVVVNFDKGTLGATGLMLKTNICPFFNNTNDLARCGWMEVEMPANTFTNSSFEILGDQIVVTLPHSAVGAQPISVRYCFADWPVATIYNAEGLPANPFWLYYR